MHSTLVMQPLVEKLSTRVGTPTIADASNPKHDISVLNRLLRGEISAINTYAQCIKKLDDGPTVAELSSMRRSHEIRRDQLNNRVSLLGGTPETHAGLWGAMASLLEGGASILGEKAALRVLEEGELHGLRQYESLGDVSSATRSFVLATLVLEQKRTAAAIRDLLRRLGEATA